MHTHSNPPRVFITGGAGYIGSHTCVELLQSGFEVCIYDNLANSSAKVIDRIAAITGKRPTFVEGDIRDTSTLQAALAHSGAQAVIHFAGLKAVGESTRMPLAYYDNNVIGTHRVLQAMRSCDVKTLIFSSSATVYGVPEFLPYSEHHRLSTTNPYGTTKLVIENMLREFAASDATQTIGILRYFNPVGAHQSGLIGEDPQSIPNNLMPYIAQVAVGRQPFLNVWGKDYDTVDGTGVRDYIHVLDLARGHVKALQKLHAQPGCIAVNLGSGTGHSVLQVVAAFERASGKTIPVQFGPRRDGDLAQSYADASLAKKLWDWQTEFDLDTMCQDVWRWQSNNPNGY